MSPTKIKSPEDLSIQNNAAPAQAREKHQSLMVWWIALRYHFTPSSFLPAILGGVAAWTLTGFYNQWFFFLAVLGVTLNHIALNLTDDYFDYHACVDRNNYINANPYSGGSGTLTGGKIKPAHMRLVFVLAYLATIGIGLYLCVVQTLWILVFGLFGMGSSYFYTAPPIRYGYRGMGEISQLINFSFTIGMGAYVVQTVSFSWEVFWILLPLGFMMFAMIIINEIPDRTDDAAAGKKTLVVRFGSSNAIRFYGIAMTMAFIIILLTPFFDMASFWIYLSFLTLPWAVQAFCILRKQINDISRLAPANLLTIRVHNLTGILLIIAYLIHGLQNQREYQQAIFSILILAAFYLPAAVPIFFKKNDRQ
ncbi:1,4-dihydroxy-2-naphthoate polyprenyltransferase [hydrocarbon metagenome]|uniref:1,4-dihydroxy-2-naphthoate polyprenyltransferase n=1 Tax=hydrocarbon metagenome TaxID=938273 RepID=A0A0W8FMT8_9ZZZZ